MAKNMARIENGVVVNIEWCANIEEESESLKEVNDLIVEIGDTYDGSAFYHNGERLLTPLEIAQAETAALKKENAALIECILEMSEIIYA